MSKTFHCFSAISLIIGIGFSLSSCDIYANDSGLVRIAMVNDVGDIDDRSFNQGTWEGLEDYLIPKNYRINKDFKYFIPITPSTADELASIDDAITWGAKAVICTGFRFEPAIYEAQEKYPDIKFLIEDGIPRPQNDINATKVANNTISMFFKEHESGFFAGYGAVYEGYHNLGYMGGISVPAVKKFGAGFVAGAYFAAKEKGINTININDHHYDYLGTFSPSAEIKAKASSWYLGGTDIIFSAAGGAGASVMSAAEENDSMMIGVDVDQAYMSKSVLTSAKKNLSKAVEIFLDRFFNTWKGGESLNLGVDMDGVSLPTEINNNVDPWRFKTFTKQQYYDVYDRIKNKEIDVPSTYEELNKFVTDLGFKLNLTQKCFDDQK